MTPARLFTTLAVALPLLSRALGVGDPAPALKTGEWVQGEPVKAFEKDKVYVVEFWATWCGPCRATIPHLNELHKKFEKQGVVVIGQNVWERDVAKVRPFLKQMGDKMTYRVALDDTSTQERGAMATDWMTAADQNGIPAAFVVDKKGVIAWIGHPGRLNEELLSAVLAGTFDAGKEAEKAQKERAAAEAGREIFMKFVAAMREEKFDDALAVLGEMEKSGDENLSRAAGGLRLGVFGRQKDWDAYHKEARRQAALVQDDAARLNELAWALVTAPGNDKPDLAAAESWSLRANELSRQENAGFLDTLARVKFLQGARDEAIRLEEKALSLEKEDKTIFDVTLAFYRKGEVPSMEQLREGVRKAKEAAKEKSGVEI